LLHASIVAERPFDVNQPATGGDVDPRWAQETFTLLAAQHPIAAQHHIPGGSHSQM
jgi:hypothetical protein